MKAPQSAQPLLRVNMPENSYDNKYYRGYVLTLLTVVYCINILDRQVFAILMPAIKADLDLSDTQLGLLSGLAFALLYSTIGIPIAKLADKGNRTRILTVAIAVWSFMTVACGMAQNTVQLVLARVGVGVGEAGGTPPAHSIISDVFTEKFRATALAIYALGAHGGVLLGMVLGGWLAQEYNWRIAFIAVGAPGLVIAIIVKLTLKEPARSQKYIDFQKKNEPSVKEAATWLFSFSSFRHLATGAVLLGMVNYGFGQWVPSFLVRSFDISIGLVGLTLGIALGIGGAIGNFAGGYFTDRLSSKGDFRWYVWVPGICAALYVPLSWPIYFSDSVEWTIAMMFLPVVVGVSYYGPVYAMLQNIAGPNRRAMATGIMLLMTNLLGLGLGPQVIGLMSDFLNPVFGVQALQYSMLIFTTIGAVWASCHFFYASKTLRADLETASKAVI